MATWQELTAKSLRCIQSSSILKDQGDLNNAFVLSYHAVLHCLNAVLVAHGRSIKKTDDLSKYLGMGTEACPAEFKIFLLEHFPRVDILTPYQSYSKVRSGLLNIHITDFIKFSKFSEDLYRLTYLYIQNNGKVESA